MNRESGHICSNEPEEGDVREPVRPYVLGDRKLAYYPNEGEEKDTEELRLLSFLKTLTTKL